MANPQHHSQACTQHLRSCCEVRFDDDTGHTLGGPLGLAGGLLTVGTLSTRVDGVKWLEIEDLDTSMGLGTRREGTNDTSVDGVLIFGREE